MVPLFLAILVAGPVFAALEYEAIVEYRDYGAVDRIIGGVPASIEEFPFIVGLLYEAKADKKTVVFLGCGGAILNENWVLTVEYCLEFPNVPNNTKVELIKIQAGTSNRHRDGVLRGIADSVTHRYTPHNIALLKVDEPLPLNGVTIAAARLPHKNAKIPLASNATIMGWGSTDMEGTLSDQLMKQDVVVIGDNYCNETWLFWSQNVSFIKAAEFCTLFDPHYTPSLTFQGDAGSPVVVNGKVVGLVSWGSYSTYLPNVHVRVSAYIHWIEDIAGPLLKNK